LLLEKNKNTTSLESLIKSERSNNKKQDSKSKFTNKYLNAIKNKVEKVETKIEPKIKTIKKEDLSAEKSEKVI
jgi:hypothetical protein